MSVSRNRKKHKPRVVLEGEFIGFSNNLPKSREEWIMESLEDFRSFLGRPVDTSDLRDVLPYIDALVDELHPEAPYLVDVVSHEEFERLPFFLKRICSYRQGDIL